MIARFFKKLIGSAGISSAPTRIPKSTHKISADKFSLNALKIIRRLRDHGFDGYVVGGAVRDLLLKKQPKDFDVVTDATPEQIRKIFRRSRIIGRRFQLVHVYFGPEIIEVSTFRATSSKESEKSNGRSGRVLRDNNFGSIEEDAKRRDFTANSLYYDPETEEVLDFCSGYADLHRKSLKMIGVPSERYREDPVRMLRAIRLAVKLNLKIEDKTQAPFKKLSKLLFDIPDARLFDELMKILKGGAAKDTVDQLVKFKFHTILLPSLKKNYIEKDDKSFINLVLLRTDERIAQGKSVSPSFIFAAILWPEVHRQWLKNDVTDRPMMRLAQSIDIVTDQRENQLLIPKRLIADIRDIWYLQGRLLNRSGKRALSAIRHPRFRAGFDFLELRSQVGQVDSELVRWWDEFQFADSELQRSMVDDVDDKKTSRRRRRRKPRNTDARMLTENR